jgi:hypothetical protein
MGCYSKPDSAPSTRPTVDVGPAMLPTPATGSRSGRTDRREDRFIVLIHDLDYVILRSGRTTQNDEENLLQARAQESWTSAIGDEVQFLGGPEKERGRGTASRPLFFSANYVVAAEPSISRTANSADAKIRIRQALGRVLRSVPEES